MLIKSPSQRISLLDILQDKQLRNYLENPQNGTISNSNSDKKFYKF